MSYFGMRHLKSLALAITLLVSGGSAFALEISYGGRLADEMGSPLTGPVEVVFSFYDAAEGGSRLLTLPRRSVSLADGVFQVSLELTAVETEALFGDGDRSVFIEVQHGSRVFPRQKFSYVPLALRVPVDGNRIVYDSQGRLTLAYGALGDLNLGSRATLGLGRYSNAEQATLVATFTASDKGKTWYNSDTGEIKYFNGTAVVTMPTGGGISGNLGDTLVRKSGDTMSGPLAMGAQKITGLGTPTDANDASSKGYVDGYLGGYPLDQQSKGPGSVIKWDSVNQKFVFAADQVGNTGSGIASLNGLGSSSQSLAASVTGVSSGTKPEWTSADSSHALVFPMASDSGVSAGLLSKTSFDSFNAKQSAITPSSVVAMGTVTSALQRGVEILPYASSAGATGELRLRELGGSGHDYVGFKAPDAVPSNTIWTLPSSDGPGGYVLGTNGSGTLSWISPTAGAVTSIATGTGLTGGPILGVGTISLATVGTGGTYTKVTTNPQGQVTSGSSLTDADIPSLNAAKITSGTLSVVLGGTGATSFTNNGVLVGSGSSPLSATLAGAQYQVLRAEAGGAPAFGAISLNQSAAVSGVLPLINGGTGAATAAGARTNLGLGSAATFDTGTSANNVVQLDGTAKLPAVDGTQLTGVVKIAGDTMTGALRLPADGLAVGSNQFVLSGGNVGIGTINPIRLLHVSGQDSAGALSPGLTISATNSGGRSYSIYTTGDLWPETSGKLLIKDETPGAGPRVTVDSAGNVGIGTISPQQLLDVSGNVLALNTINTRGLADLAPTSSLTVSGGNVSGAGGPHRRSFNSYWQATVVGQTATFDLGAEETNLRAVAFSTFYREDATKIPAGYAIDYSVDNSAWTNLATVTGNSKTAVIHFGEFTARYVRITVNAFQSGQSLSIISGLQILSSKGAALSGVDQAWATSMNNNVVMATGGNVGIGTTSPSGTLDVATRSTASGWPGGAISIGDSSSFATASDTAINGLLTFKGANWLNGYLAYYPHKTDGNAYFRITGASSAFGDAAVGLLVDGRVGIGTTLPYGNLDVAGTIINSNATGTVRGGLNASSGNFLSIEAFNGNNTVKYPIALAAYGGNVGIGTTAPVAKLDVNGALNLNGEITRTTASGTAAWMQQDGTGRQHWYWNTTGGFTPTFSMPGEDASDLMMHVTNTGAGGYLLFRQSSGLGKNAGDAVTWENAFTASKAGIRIGDGALATNKLDVVGSAAIGSFAGTAAPPNGMIVSGNVGVGTTAPIARFNIGGSIDGGDGIAIFQQANNSHTIQSYIDGHWADRSTYAGGCCNDLLLQPDVGRVGIGTTSPSDVLHVVKSGTGVTGGVIIQAGTAESTNNVGTLILRNIGGGGGNVDATLKSYYTGSQYALGIDTISANYPITMQTANGGNVGIGTASPTARLDIDGSLKATRIVRGVDSYTLQLPNVAQATWYKLGNWTSSAGGRAEIVFHSATGYGAGAIAEQGMTRTQMSMGNGTNGPNIIGYYWVEGGSPAALSIKAKKADTCVDGQNCMSWDLFAQVSSFSGTDNFIEVKIGPSSTWTGSITAATDPGAASTAVAVFPNNLTIPTGNVGLGTSTPFSSVGSTSGSYPSNWQGLHINSSSGAGTAIIQGNSTARLHFASNAGAVNARNMVVDYASTGYLSFSSLQDSLAGSKSHILVVDGVGGNIGIGTTAPATLLNLASGNTPAIRLSNNAGVGNGWANGPLSAIEFWQSDEGSNNGDGKIATKLQQTIYDINGNTRFDIYSNIANGDNMPATPAMTIKEGAIGIGTTSPTQALEVTQSIRVNSGASSTTDCPAGWGCSYFRDISISSIYYNGLTQRSDKRLKTNIQSLSADDLARLEKLEPVSYEWINPMSGSGTKYGFIAQEVEKIWPEIISTATDFQQTKSMDYTALIAPLVLGMKDYLHQKHFVTVNQSGNVGIGTTSPSHTLHVVGSAGLSSGTAWTNASDIRLKDIDGGYEHGLDEIKKLHTVRFHYKRDNPLQLPSDQAMTGFIAQEVQEVIPEAVTKRADGYLELNVDPIHWATVNAVKELAAENETLKQRADEAEKRADHAAAELFQLKAEAAELRAFLCGQFPAAPICRSPRVTP